MVTYISPCVGARAVLFADFGEGEGLIFLDDVDCQGSEKFLNECSSNELGKHNCKHSSDAGVICPGVCVCKSVLVCSVYQ